MNDEFDRTPPRYYSDNEKLRSIGTQLLQTALIEASQDTLEMDELWGLFRDFVSRYQYGLVIDRLFDHIEDEVRESIHESIYESERKAAIEALKKDIYQELSDKFLNELSDEVYEEVQAHLWDTASEELKKDARQLISADLIEDIKEELREELSSNEEFIASVKREMKIKLLEL